MPSPTIAILWEIWARNRWAVIFALGIIPLCAAAMLFARWIERTVAPLGFSPVAVALVMSVIAAMLSVASLFWVFAFTSLDERGRFGGFPSHLYRLPLKTGWMAGVPIFAGAVVMGTVYVAWFMLVVTGIRNEVGAPPGVQVLAWQLLVLLTGLGTVQMLAWLLYPLRLFRGFVLAAACSLFFILWVWVPENDFFGQPTRCFVAGLVAFAGVFMAAASAVRFDRHGGVLPLWRMKAARLRSAPFANPARAQVWFEWRRKGVFAALVLGMTMGLSLLVWPIPALLGTADGTLPSIVQVSTFWALPLMALFMAAAVGSSFGKPDLWSPELELPSFFAVRPVTSMRLALAKMAVAARAIALGWCIFLLVGSIVVRFWWDPGIEGFWTGFGQDHPALWRWATNPFVIAALMVIHWHALVQGMSATMSGRKGRIIFIGWRRVAILFALSGAAIWLVRHPSKIPACLNVLPWLAALLVAAKAVRAAGAFQQIKLQRLASHQDWLFLLSLWSGVAVCVIVAAAMAQRSGGLPPELIWFLGACAMPGSELPACVTNLALNRHR